MDEKLRLNLSWLSRFFNSILQVSLQTQKTKGEKHENRQAVKES